MDMDAYQWGALQTAVYPVDKGLEYVMLGLTSEVGEVAGKYKKYLRDGGEFTEVREGLLKEAGDVLWYLTMLVDELDSELSTVAEDNLVKLRSRADRGVLKGSGDSR